MRPATTSRIAAVVFALTLAIAVILGIGFLDLVWIPIALGASAISLLGAFIVRRTGNPIGWIFQCMALAGSVSLLSDTYVHSAYIPEPRPLPLIPLAAWLSNISGLLLALPLPLLFLLFPTGRPASPRWRWAVRLWAAGAALVLAWSAFKPDAVYGDPSPRIPSIENPIGIPGTKALFTIFANGGGAMVLAAGVLGVISLILRFRRAGREERQQLKWLTFVGLLAGIFVLIGFVVDLVLPTAEAQGGLADTLSTVVWGVLLVTLTIGTSGAVAIAILKYRLYDIDVVINKTVVFGALAAFITAVYVAIVVGVGSLVGAGGEPNVALSILATAVVAVAFQPVRTRVQRFANRLVYGERATPYEVLSRFSQRAAGTYAMEDVLPRTARVLAEGTGAARAEVWLRVGRELVATASWPGDANGERRLPIAEGEFPAFAAADRALPVRHQGELLGAITVTKPPGERLTPEEDKLLADLASQAGSVLRNVGMTAELQARLEELAAQAAELRASRQRIVAAHDAERRRLERNIHDGAQQHLVALAVKLRLAKATAARDPSKGKRMLEELQEETADAMATLGELSRGIYPQVLEEHGIAAALEVQALRSSVPVRVRADGVGRHPIEVEAAVYFCCLEALQNSSKYAGASAVEIQLEEDGGDLAFSVADDGSGFDPKATPGGTGLQSMLDRLAVLGGTVEVTSAPGRGTRVSGRLPAPAVRGAR